MQQSYRVPAAFYGLEIRRFLVGVDDERVEEVLDIIKTTSHSRGQFMTPQVGMDASMDASASYPIEVQVGGATVFVLPVEQFHQF